MYLQVASFREPLQWRRAMSEDQVIDYAVVVENTLAWLDSQYEMAAASDWRGPRGINPMAIDRCRIKLRLELQKATPAAPAIEAIATPTGAATTVSAPYPEDLHPKCPHGCGHCSCTCSWHMCPAASRGFALTLSRIRANLREDGSNG